jgi:hypothetical protein
MVNNSKLSYIHDTWEQPLLTVLKQKPADY